MKINHKQKDDIRVIELSGELDFHSSPLLRDLLQKILSEKVSKILVDLKKISYIDSSGLATFIEAFQKIKHGNGRLVLAGLVPQVRSVFEIAKLDHIFEMHASDEEALKALSGI